MASDFPNQQIPVSGTSGAWMGGAGAPRLSSPGGGANTDSMNAHYSQVMFDSLTTDYYAGSDFYNFGYWEKGTTSPKEASEALMEKLLALIPKKSGNILDVACGMGATTRHLLRYYRPADVTAINISEEQLKRCASNAPGCTFLVMDATQLKFEANSFDNIICVEAAFHFRTREKFLREAHRVLKPGGRLVMEDLLMTREGEARAPRHHPANYIESPAHYKEILDRIGFVNNEVTDVTEHTDPHFRHVFMFMLDQYARKHIEKKVFVYALRSLLWVMGESCYGVLVAAQKPAETAATPRAAY